MSAIHKYGFWVWPPRGGDFLAVLARGLSDDRPFLRGLAWEHCSEFPGRRQLFRNRILRDRAHPVGVRFDVETFDFIEAFRELFFFEIKTIRRSTNFRVESTESVVEGTLCQVSHEEDGFVAEVRRGVAVLDDRPSDGHDSLLSRGNVRKLRSGNTLA